MDPSEQDVDTVMSFTCLSEEDRPMVIQALKHNNCNREKVIELYYDSESAFRQKYANGGNEDGSLTQGISFHVEAPGEDDAGMGASSAFPAQQDGWGVGAPSRPPSRNDNRSLGGAVNFGSVGEISGAPSSKAQEDEDMQRAIRESAQEAGVSVPAQETGIIGLSTSAAYFGPANRNEYKTEDWAVVPTDTQQFPSNSAPSPSLRRRSDGAPAFLVQGYCSQGRHSLGGLFTILHEIPLARNSLLELGSIAPTYGHNSEWWKGQEIIPPSVLSLLQSGQMNLSDIQHSIQHIQEEVHRLMAFLDSTERSYGTVSVLSDLIDWQNNAPEKQFFELLSQHYPDQVQRLFHTAVLAMVRPAESEGENEDQPEETTFHVLETDHTPDDYKSITTLYESLDHVFWSDVLSMSNVFDHSTMAVLRHPGDILTIRCGGEGLQGSIEIPEILYPERWLESRKSEAIQIQQSWAETRNIIESLETARQGLGTAPNGTVPNSIGEGQKLQKAIEQWKAYSEYLETSVRFRAMQDAGFDTDKYPDYRSAPCHMDQDDGKTMSTIEEAIRFAESKLARTQIRDQELEQQIEHAQAKQRALGRLLTMPDKPGRPKPMSEWKYYLRGVTTSPDTVYVCRRREQDLIELETTPPLDQWWRLSFSPSEEPPVKAEKMDLDDILQRIWNETKKPTLVYATEDALNVTPEPLPGPLERFVKAENKSFAQELNQESSTSYDEPMAGLSDPVSPSKRKHRSDSIDSMNSNQASMGSDERNRFDDPFEDQLDGTVMQMRSMPVETPREAWIDEEAWSRGNDDSPPPLPKRRMSRNGTTNANSDTGHTTALPGTEHTNVPSSQDETGFSGTVASNLDRSPEMQERARPPPFMSKSQDGSEQRAKEIDMDMADE